LKQVCKLIDSGVEQRTRALNRKVKLVQYYLKLTRYNKLITCCHINIDLSLKMYYINKIGLRLY